MRNKRGEVAETSLTQEREDRTASVSGYRPELRMNASTFSALHTDKTAAFVLRAQLHA